MFRQLFRWFFGNSWGGKAPGVAGGKPVERRAGGQMTLAEAMDKSLLDGYHSVEWGQFGSEWRNAN